MFLSFQTCSFDLLCTDAMSHTPIPRGAQVNVRKSSTAMAQQWLHSNTRHHPILWANNFLRGLFAATCGVRPSLNTFFTSFIQFSEFTVQIGSRRQFLYTFCLPSFGRIKSSPVNETKAALDSFHISCTHRRRTLRAWPDGQNSTEHKHPKYQLAAAQSSHNSLAGLLYTQSRAVGRCLSIRHQ